MQDLLQSLRNQIDTIDEELVYLLYRRFEIVKEIGVIKKNEDLDMTGADRKQHVLNVMLEEARDKGVDLKLVTRIHELIHEESLKIQK